MWCLCSGYVKHHLVQFWFLKAYDFVMESKKSHGILHEKHSETFADTLLCLLCWWVMLDNLVCKDKQSQFFLAFGGASVFGTELQLPGRVRRDFITLLFLYIKPVKCVTCMVIFEKISKRDTLFQCFSGNRWKLCMYVLGRYQTNKWSKSWYICKYVSVTRWMKDVTIYFIFTFEKNNKRVYVGNSHVLV